MFGEKGMRMMTLKKILVSLIAAMTVMLSSVPVLAATPDEAAIVSRQEDLTPLYTTASDSSLRDYSHHMSADEGILFHTQTTALALITGYLILFKVKGIPHGEKMHRRRKT